METRKIRLSREISGRMSRDKDAQRQVLANLANFAYDPINYAHLKESSVVELFLEQLTSANPRLILHAIAGLCNLVPDNEARDRIIQANGIKSMLPLLRHPEHNIVINVLAALIQLDASGTRNQLSSRESISQLETLKQSENVIVRNLATVLLTQLTAPVAP